MSRPATTEVSGGASPGMPVPPLVRLRSAPGARLERRGPVRHFRGQRGCAKPDRSKEREDADLLLAIRKVAPEWSGRFPPVPVPLTINQSDRNRTVGQDETLP